MVRSKKRDKEGEKISIKEDVIRIMSFQKSKKGREFLEDGVINGAKYEREVKEKRIKIKFCDWRPVWNLTG